MNAKDLRGEAETAGGARSAPSVGEGGREVFHFNRSICVRQEEDYPFQIV